MVNKILKTRVQNKCDTAANWKLATNFKPLKGEIILYTDTKQMKVGDGNTLVDALPFYPSGDVTAAGDNIFTGKNTFKDTFMTFVHPTDTNKTTTINDTNIVIDSGENLGNPSATLSDSGLRFFNGGAETKYNMGNIYFDGHSFNFSAKDGTLALTSDISDYVQANPTASGTTSLTKLKVGDTVYGLFIGNSSTTVISKTISAWPTATAPVSISFTTDENSKISNKDTFKNVIIQVEINEKNYVCLYPVGYGNIIYRFASSDNVYTLIITGGVGSMTYTKPAEIAGNNTFTGSNTFSTVKVQTNAQTYTTISPTNISGKSGGVSYSLVLPVKTSTLATLDDLSSLFTYADNTLTINI